MGFVERLPLTACAQYWLTPQDARLEARRVAQVIDGWREHFAAQGVSNAAIEELAQHIDRPFLREQRLAS
jgi:serine/threonine-protein kinase HipA